LPSLNIFNDLGLKYKTAFKSKSAASGVAERSQHIILIISEENRMFAKVFVKAAFIFLLMAVPTWAQTKLLRFPTFPATA